MATSVFGEPGTSAAPVRSAAGRVPMVVPREISSRRTVTAALLSLDDSTLATFGYDRRAIEEVGRRPLTL